MNRETGTNVFRLFHFLSGIYIDSAVLCALVARLRLLQVTHGPVLAERSEVSNLAPILCLARPLKSKHSLLLQVLLALLKRDYIRWLQGLPLDKI